MAVTCVASQKFEFNTATNTPRVSPSDAYPKAIYENLLNMRGGMNLFGLSQAALYDRGAEKFLATEITKLISELKK